MFELIMDILDKITTEFTSSCREILGGSLTGVYLHGSAVMGCFNEQTSDIDMLVIVNGPLTDDKKRKFMEMTVDLNRQATKKGIEMSIVQRRYCRPFVYPTPFELHFSSGTLSWYQTAPDDYIKKMNGTDRDLAAHFTIIKKYGKCLFGEPIDKVFGEVPEDDYFDSIFSDIDNAEEDIISDTCYITLNLCRVLAYKRDRLILSKEGGGKWGLESLPAEFHTVISQALDCYTRNIPMDISGNISVDFAKCMITMIKG